MQTAHRPDDVPASGSTGVTKPRVVIAVDLPEALCQRIEQAEPRVEVIRDHSLYRPRRGPADWPGDPDHHRTEAQQQAYRDIVDSAELLCSPPDGGGAGS